MLTRAHAAGRPAVAAALGLAAATLSGAPAAADERIHCPAVGHSRSGCEDVFPAGETIRYHFEDGCRKPAEFVLSWGEEARWTARTPWSSGSLMRFRPDDRYWDDAGQPPPSDVRATIRIKPKGMEIRNFAGRRDVTIRWTLDCARD